MREKVRVLKLIANFLGICIGLTYSIIVLIITFMIVKFRTVIISEPNVFISIFEFTLALLSTIYFCHRALRFLSKKEIDKYLYK